MRLKRPLRLLFALVLLSVSVTAVLRRFVHLENRFSVKQRPHTPLSLNLNSTLLKFAAIDVAEAKAKHDVEQLLEGGFRRVLRDWFLNKRFQPEIMLHLLELVKGPLDQYNGVKDKNGVVYSSCAVVGNSGVLLKSENGKLIDSHEVVIRLNNARTKGFEHNVGSKTSISFVNSYILHFCARREGCYCHPYGETVPIVTYICHAAHIIDYLDCNSTHKAPLLVMDGRFDVLCARIVKYYSLKKFVEETGKGHEEWASAHDGSLFQYSSGLQAVMLAVGMCGKVSMFGFGKSAIAKHHYHTDQKAELHFHDYEAEYAFYHDLEANPQVIPFIMSKFKIPPVVIYH